MKEWRTPRFLAGMTGWKPKHPGEGTGQGRRQEDVLVCARAPGACERWQATGRIRTLVCLGEKSRGLAVPVLGVSTLFLEAEGERETSGKPEGW